MKEYRVLRPSNIGELNSILKKEANLCFIAGGTDLIVNKKVAALFDVPLVDLSAMTDLKYIKEDGGYIRIGALTTFKEISTNNLIRRMAKCLSDSSSQIGSVQIRNMATIGGNICFASPAADSFPPLAVLGSFVKILGPDGERSVPIEGFISDLRKTCLKRNEIVKEIYFPYKERLSSFSKIGNRKSVTISKLSLAASVECSVGGYIEKSDLAIGSIGKSFIKPIKAINYLKGKKLDAFISKEFEEILSCTIKESISGRASMPYKKEAIKGLVENIYEDIIKMYTLGGK